MDQSTASSQPGAPGRAFSVSATVALTAKRGHGRTTMPYHNAISSLASAALLILSIPGAHAFDESRYPNWKGQWVERGVVRTSGWDSKLPAGAGEQVFLTPEYQAIFAASVKAEADGGPPVDPTSRCVPAGMP